jgi:hypothetical protein
MTLLPAPLLILPLLQLFVRLLLLLLLMLLGFVSSASCIRI